MHETTSLHVERFESSDLKAELSVCNFVIGRQGVIDFPCKICYNLYLFAENRNII